MEALLTAVIGLVLIGVVFGLSFWANRARTDRSAYVGLYLVIGSPAVLLAVAGVALMVVGNLDGLSVLIGALALGLPLLMPVRRLLARFIPIDPASPRDMVGLSLFFGAMAFFTITLANQGGPPEAASVASPGLLDLVVQAVLFVGLAYATVGWRVYRSGREATARLGIRRPDWRTVVYGVGFVLVGFVFSAIGGILTEIFQPDFVDDLNVVTETLTGEVQNPVGAVVLGASAGIGEEALFRGALQPRFGIVLTSALFALVHSQYGFSFVILGLFGIGMLLGFERQRYGTVTAMVTHATYNALTVLLTTYT